MLCKDGGIRGLFVKRRKNFALAQGVPEKQGLQRISGTKLKPKLNSLLKIIEVIAPIDF